eukprot:2019202-Alexandrium_andersonii.AAC.1
MCKRAAAIQLSSGISASWRYVESKRNPADGPTRPLLPAARASWAVAARRPLDPEDGPGEAGQDGGQQD